MNYHLLQKLLKFKKEYFTISDLSKIFKQDKPSLYVTLNRAVKKGWLSRLKSGIYQISTAPARAEKIANQIYYPSYLSFESALAKHGILSQIPYTLTFATPKRTKRMTIMGNEVIFRQLRKELFWGYKLSDGIYLAEPEKALLDQLYLVCLGKNSINLKELDLKSISKTKISKFVQKFPRATQKLAKELSFNRS